jgi:hypothetical protein
VSRASNSFTAFTSAHITGPEFSAHRFGIIDAVQCHLPQRDRLRHDVLTLLGDKADLGRRFGVAFDLADHPEPARLKR